MPLDNRRWSARRGRSLRETRDRHERKHRISHQARPVRNHHGPRNNHGHGIRGGLQGNQMQMHDSQPAMHRSPAPLPLAPALNPDPPIHGDGDGYGMPSNAPTPPNYFGTRMTSRARAKGGRSASLDLAIDELVRWGVEQGQRMRMRMQYASHGSESLQYGEVWGQEQQREQQQQGVRSRGAGWTGINGRGSSWRPRYGAYGRDDGRGGGERPLGSAPYKDHWKGFQTKRD